MYADEVAVRKRAHRAERLLFEPDVWSASIQGFVLSGLTIEGGSFVAAISDVAAILAAQVPSTRRASGGSRPLAVRRGPIRRRSPLAMGQPLQLPCAPHRVASPVSFVRGSSGMSPIRLRSRLSGQILLWESAISFRRRSASRKCSSMWSISSRVLRSVRRSSMPVGGTEQVARPTLGSDEFYDGGRTRVSW